MGSVGEDALDDATECVEDGGAAAGVHAETAGDVGADAAYGEDGHGVVGREDVGEADEGGDGPLCTALPTDAAGELADEIVEEAGMAHHGEESTGHEGYEYGLLHTCHAFADCVAPRSCGEGSGGESDETGKEVAGEEDYQDIDTEKGEDDDGEGGEDEEASTAPLTPPKGGCCKRERCDGKEEEEKNSQMFYAFHFLIFNFSLYAVPPGWERKAYCLAELKEIKSD